MVQQETIRMKVYRSPSQDKEDEAKEGKYEDYEVPYKDRMTILNALDYIQGSCDRSLAYYQSCRIGKCTGCLVEVDGKNKLACTTLAKDGIKIGPAKKCRVIRDFVVEFPR